MAKFQLWATLKTHRNKSAHRALLLRREKVMRLVLVALLAAAPVFAQEPIAPAFGGVPIYDASGKYRGVYSNNRYDIDSTSNPIGRYGSEYSPDSLNNEVQQIYDQGSHWNYSRDGDEEHGDEEDY